MSLTALEDLAKSHHLANFGSINLQPDDGLGDGALVLLGPKEPSFWDHVTRQPEFLDGTPDALDRWSYRVISALADQLGGAAVFPFGTPVRPFMTWALRSVRAWSSPVGILVHDRAGLMVSYRGAVALPGLRVNDAAGAKPCDTCEGQPCRSACPAAALTGSGYDLAACHSHLDAPEGLTCMTQGCAVRCSCPLSRSYGRLPAQSEYHMSHFHT